MNKNLNDTNFKFIVFLPIIYVFINILWVIDKLLFNNFKLSIYDLYIINIKAFFITTVLLIIALWKDRSLLKKNLSYCPSWGWYFIFPVYIYKRQKYNALGLTYFWIYMVSKFIFAYISMKILTSLLFTFIELPIINKEPSSYFEKKFNTKAKSMQLPIKIDKITTLYEYYAIGFTVHYKYNINASSKDIDLSILESNLFGSFKENYHFCNSDGSQVLPILFSFDYYFNTDNSNKSFLKPLSFLCGG